MNFEGFEVEWWDGITAHDFDNVVAVSRFKSKRPAYLMRLEDYIKHEFLALAGHHQSLFLIYPKNRV